MNFIIFCGRKNAKNEVRNNVQMILLKFKMATTSHFLAPAVTVGETEGAMDSASVFFLPLLLPITL